MNNLEINEKVKKKKKKKDLILKLNIYKDRFSIIGI